MGMWGDVDVARYEEHECILNYIHTHVLDIYSKSVKNLRSHVTAVVESYMLVSWDMVVVGYEKGNCEY